MVVPASLLPWLPAQKALGIAGPIISHLFMPGLRIGPFSLRTAEVQGVQNKTKTEGQRIKVWRTVNARCVMFHPGVREIKAPPVGHRCLACSQQKLLSVSKNPAIRGQTSHLCLSKTAWVLCMLVEFWLVACHRGDFTGGEIRCLCSCYTLILLIYSYCSQHLSVLGFDTLK